MATFLLHHRHAPDECRAAFAAWCGFESPLRHRPTASTCLAGGHALWWRVDAPRADDARAMLPAFVARRTLIVEVRDVVIP
jgi:hypothetical protein